ncbi:MAG: hypothetical protein U5L98_08445 [Halomonas sp.]|uniref:hypothetical protein n=1 Tax=Halomonas sp. TaxID=1486246 RepID=UPI002ACD8107|nr:hypothetical protein [Halomonas sp.]MDZ7852657.1 hypothetical protein [Halomonas sp.]
MKLLLITESDELQDRIAREFRPHQVEIIQYWSPLKGMDNLDEVAPDVVIFSAVDFPRHWKTFLMFLRNSYARDRIIYVLLVSESFDSDEASTSTAPRRECRNRRVAAESPGPQQARGISSRATSVSTKAAAIIVTHPMSSTTSTFCLPTRGTSGSFRAPSRDISTTGIRFSPHTRSSCRTSTPGACSPPVHCVSAMTTSPWTAPSCETPKASALTFERIDETARQRVAEYLENHTQRAIEHASS